MTDERMDADLMQRVCSDPQFHDLVRKRGRFRWLLTGLMLIAYFCYIGLIAFDKSILAQPVGAGVTSVGIPVGIALILFTVVITGVYVIRANGEFDRMTRDIVERASQ